MLHPRPLIAILLALVLSLTGVELAVARGAPGPAGVMVLCTSIGVTTVAVDAQGQPVAPGHVCPDCVLTFLGLPGGPLVRSAPVVAGRVAHVSMAVLPCAAPGMPPHRARAPPGSGFART